MIKCMRFEAIDRMLYVYLLLFWSSAASSAALLLCHTCRDSNSLDKCLTSTQCGNKQSCFTRIQTMGQKKIYTMGCTDNENCGNIPVYDDISSFSGSPIDQCYECCRSDKCNNVLCNHRKPSDCTDKENVDCATLNEMFDICNDTHDVKFVCPKFCSLCSLVDGNWNDWSSWSICDVTCGQGKHTRIRTCTNPAPAHQGLDCKGNNIDTKPCVRPLCPVHGGWSDWSNWKACPVTCGIGIQKRFRKCDNPYPLRYGDHCFGDAVDVRICAQETCDGETWTNWDNWGICSATCNGGLRKRSRSCSKKRSALYGNTCKGDSIQIQMCNTQDCPCSSLPDIQNGVLKRIIETTDNTTFYVECNEGYELSGSSYTNCDQHGQWDDIPTCKKVSCGIPASPFNGRIAFKSGITFRENILVECFDSYFVVGNPVSSCLGSGTWSQLPTCEKVVVITSCSKKPTYNSSFTNVAIRKDVKISSQYPGHDNRGKMVDGDYNSSIHTIYEKDPYAMVDLEDIYLVHSVYIVNRKRCCATRLHDVIIQVGNDPSRLNTVFRHKTAIGTDCTLLFKRPYRARYVKIQLEAEEFLHIGELEVYSLI